MTELITILSTGKGTWSDVAKLINKEEWSKIFIVTNEFGQSTFNKKDNMDFVIINPDEDIIKIIQDITNQLKDKVNGPQVALNFISGTGKEHKALLCALIELGVGIKVVTIENNQLIEL